MATKPTCILPGLPSSYTAIDFETANEFERASACAVAVVRIEDGRLAARHSWLINPQTRFSATCIAVHGILTVYKNLIILIATALFISRNHSGVLVATVGVALLYYFILRLMRKAHSQIVKHYYDYKY